MKKPETFPAAMKHFFGLKKDQQITGFMAELKALSLNDKADFTAMLKAEGYPLKG